MSTTPPTTQTATSDAPRLSAPWRDALAQLSALPDDATIAVGSVGLILSCSARHVWRMADGGLMPAPLRLGKLRRWHLGTLRRWIAQGCPAVRSSRK